MPSFKMVAPNWYLDRACFGALQFLCTKTATARTNLPITCLAIQRICLCTTQLQGLLAQAGVLCQGAGPQAGAPAAEEAAAAGADAAGGGAEAGESGDESWFVMLPFAGRPVGQWTEGRAAGSAGER